MKKRSLLYILAAAVLCMVWACVKDLEKEGVSNTTQYIGTVVEKSTMQPVEGVSVQVTDGSHVHAVSVTDRNGRFKLTDVNFDELGDDCYLWLDGTALDLPSKQEPLMGLGSKVYDYKNIILYDKTNVDLLPRVTTGDVSNIMEHTATVSGSVSSNGGHALTARGICWATHQSPTIDDFHATAGVEIGSFSCNLTDLQGSTTYYYRAYATNSVGTTYGSQKDFTTGNGLPTVSITAVSSIGATSAVCGGDIVSDGGNQITAKGLCWSTSQYPTIDGTHVSLGTGLGNFTGSMTGLSIGTTYYVRAYATNSQGTAYSEQQTFTTGNGLPTVTTTNPSMSGNSVVSGGNVTSDGGYPVTARGICYGVYPNPDLTAAYTHTNNGTGTGYFSSVVDTNVGRTLYVRAYATNANGTSYGNQVLVDLDYLALPTFQYNGHTYRVAPDPHTSYTEYISWDAANTYCENLTAYGYTDWRMPTIEELETMYQNRVAIGGFIDYYNNNSGTSFYPIYHSSTQNTYYYYTLSWTNGVRDYHGYQGDLQDYYRYGVGGLHMTKQYNCHVRPIRVEN